MTKNEIKKRIIDMIMLGAIHEFQDDTDQLIVNALIASRKNERKRIRHLKDTSDESIRDFVDKAKLPEEKALIIKMDNDLKMTQGRGILSQETRRYIIDSVDTGFDYVVFTGCLKLYIDIGKFGLKVEDLNRRYQVEIAELSGMIDLWMRYDKEASTLTDSYKEVKEAGGDVGTIERMANSLNCDNVTFKVEDGRFKADIFGKGGLYERMKEVSERAERNLSNLKAAADVLIDFITDHDGYIGFTPAKTLDMFEHIFNETYSRCIIPTEYHMSTINHKAIDKGEEVTDEERIRGLVPDYVEVKPKDEQLREYEYDLNELRRSKPLRAI